MPTLLSAEPMTEEEIKEICRKWREQQAQHDPEMRGLFAGRRYGEGFLLSCNFIY